MLVVMSRGTRFGMKSGMVGGTSWLGPGLRASGSPSNHIASPPLVGFILAYALTGTSLAIAGHFLGRDGFDLLIVAMGWPHIILGLLFNLSRLGSCDRRYQLIFCNLLTVTVAISFVHSVWPITTIIYLYFVFHAFRDEIFIYRQRASRHRFRGAVFDDWGRVLLAATVLAALAGQVASYHPAVRLKTYLAFCGLGVIFTVFSLLKWPQTVFEKVPGSAYASVSFLLVVGAMTGLRILRMQGITAPFFFSFLVVFHYFSWYVFSLEKIAARPPLALEETKTGVDRILQLMGTQRGFVTAVVLLNAISFAGASAVFWRSSATSLAWVFDLKYFVYFLVFHVTISFAPKGPARIPGLRPETA